MASSDRPSAEYIQMCLWDEGASPAPETEKKRREPFGEAGPEELAAVSERMEALKSSKFRQSFHLKKKDFQYIREKGMETILNHARDMIASRLAPAVIPNDGKQTPWRGHPVFLAQHATGTCCRSCLKKWHQFEPGRELTGPEQHYIVSLIMRWIEKEQISGPFAPRENPGSKCP